AAMRDILEINDAAILVNDDGTIEDVGPASSFDIHHSTLSVDCRGLIALPGFVDSHTHCVFAGERSQEFAMRAEGRSYQEIAALGGGIRSSVGAIQSASLEEIVEHS